MGGGSVSASQEYAEVGVCAEVEAASWSAAGFDSYEASRYVLADITDPAAASRWRQAGVNGNNAICFVVAGVDTLPAATKWLEAGLDGWDAVELRRCGRIASVAAELNLPPVAVTRMGAFPR